MKNLHRSLVIGCSALALAGCGADDIASPGGTGVVINQPATPAPTPTPGPTPTPTVSAPDICPNLTNDGSVQLTNAGTISGPTGSYRICQLPSLITKSVELPRIAGVLYGLDKAFKPFNYFQILLPIFAAAIVGGLGSPLGAIAGGFVVAFSEVAITYPWLKVVGYLFPDWQPGGLLQLLGTEYKFAVSFVILIVVLLFKPTGLFRGRPV